MKMNLRDSLSASLKPILISGNWRHHNDTNNTNYVLLKANQTKNKPLIYNANVYSWGQETKKVLSHK